MLRRALINLIRACGCNYALTCPQPLPTIKRRRSADAPMSVAADIPVIEPYRCPGASFKGSIRAKVHTT